METTPRKRIVLLSFTILAFALLLGWGDLGQRSEKRYLIIHADDAGMCRSVNTATIKALEEGIVTSASIMVPCPAFEEFAEYAARNRQYDFGIHLTLTSEPVDFRWGPVLPVEQVPSLVDEEGRLWEHTGLVARWADIDQVEAELRAQIRRAIGCGVRPTHLDHHMFVMFARPDLLQLYIQLGREFDLPVSLAYKMGPQRQENLNEDLQTSHANAIAKLVEWGYPVLDFIESDNYSVAAEEKRTYFLDVLRNLQPGVSQILIHCAVNRADWPLPLQPASREADTRVFTSIEMAEEIKRLGIELTTWDRIRQASRQP